MLMSMLLAVTAVLGQAPQAEADEARAAEVRRLIREMDAPELATRDRAEAELLDMGPGVLPDLPESTERLSAEVRTRLARVRTKLEHRRAEASVEAARVTLEADAMPLSEILAAISRQTGNAIFDYRAEFGQEPDDPQLKVAFKDTPFWEAFDQVLDDAELAVYPYADKRGIAVVARNPSQASRRGHASYVGAFRLEAIELAARRDLRDQSNRALHLRLEAAWEPRLAPISIGYAMSDLDVRDEQGKSLVGEDAAANMSEFEASTPQRSISTELALPLEPPPRSVEKIGVLRGKLSALLPGTSETFRFDKLDQADGAELRRAGVVVKLERVRKNNAVWEVRVRVKFDDPGQALESHRDWMFNNKAVVVDPQGHELEPIGLETTLQTESEFGIAYLYDLEDGPAGHAFVYETPTMIFRVPVEYELRDLELP